MENDAEQARAQENAEDRAEFLDARDRQLMEQSYQFLKQTVQSRSNKDLTVGAIHQLSRLSRIHADFKEEIGDLLVDELLQKRGNGTMPRLVTYAKEIGLDKEYMEGRIQAHFLSSQEAKRFRVGLLQEYWK